MKHPARLLLAALALSAAVSPGLRAAIEIPAASPAASVSQAVGISKVTVDYHRPGVKGRKIWGGVVPYDQVWRLGANEATTITFTDPVKIKGRELAAGSYALFVLPKPGVFTVVFNSNAKQWGAFRYEESKDVLRFDLQPEASKFNEWMTFELVPAGKGLLRVEWRWEKLRFSFDVEVDVDALAWKRIDAALAKDAPSADDYLAAAKYARDEKQRLGDAMVWVDKSIAREESFWNDELKARLLADQGKYAEAIPLVEKAKALAAGKAPQPYVDGLDKTLAEWRAKVR